MTLTERLSQFFKGWPVSRADSSGLSEGFKERLLACLPAVAYRFLARHNRRLVIRPVGSRADLSVVAGLETQSLGELDLAHATALPGIAGIPEQERPHGVELRLPRADVLTRVVSFPAQVRANLPQVIRYELDRLSPFEAKDVFFDFAVQGGSKTTDRLRLDLALCRRDLVDGWIARLEALGTPIDRITWEGAWKGANLLPVERRPKRRRLRLTLGSVSGMVSILLVIAILVTPLWQKHYLARQLESEVARLRRQAVAVDEVRQELERVRQSSTFALQRKLEQPRILELLRELTDRLPDDTWVQNLEFSDDQVDLRGESGQATSLIAILEQAPSIEGVSFGSPLTQIARTGKERFNITFRYVRGGAK
ncbi:PilN domain-containing protein [Thermochromatium tepidum]|jgi:Tfp pilus assembly protein PilN|uniref:Fimbrial assembly protein n=1 Tax=Thermochromatium tepidum ATCC 43061 TaxID=316276 RepID=A0A6I6E691_THETI|nr:PilN domain-containing protein [Thermochromatium tepidum]QGU32018.1 fimbrial assembly protein [Thermochromatium tepidum ATCC 43061]